MCVLRPFDGNLIFSKFEKSSLMGNKKYCFSYRLNFHSAASLNIIMIISEVYVLLITGWKLLIELY